MFQMSRYLKFFKKAALHQTGPVSLMFAHFLKGLNCLKNSSGNINEYSMIEFQGDLETKSEEALGNKVIGDLHFNHEGNPIMIIGHHILHGKVQDLDKPLVVISKENDSVPDENNVTYGVTAVIKQKIIFKTRPKPIIGEMIKKL